MPTFLLHVEEVLQVDSRMSTSIRGPRNIPFFPTIAKSLKTKGRTISLSGHLPGYRQCSLN